MFMCWIAMSMIVAEAQAKRDDVMFRLFGGGYYFFEALFWIGVFNVGNKPQEWL